LLRAVAPWALPPPLFLWMTPVIVGLLFAVPLATLTARSGAGQALRRLGLLSIPEERDPPPILLRAQELAASLSAAEHPPREIFGAFLDSPDLVELHRRMLPTPQRRSRGDLDVHLLLGLPNTHQYTTHIYHLQV